MTLSTCRRSVVPLAIALAAMTVLMFSHPAQAQYGAPPPTGAAGGQPVVVHIHHHYYNAESPSAALANMYAPSYAYHYGFQQNTGTMASPLQQNWGRLGFTGYLGQHGGGVDITPESLNVFTGLVVNTVTPGSPASNMGLVPGDFILKIDGTAVDNYKQAAILFEQSEQGANPTVELTVWNPHTRRTIVLKTIVDQD